MSDPAAVLETIRRSIRSAQDAEFEWLRTEFVPWAHVQVPVARARVALVTTGGVYLGNDFHEPFDSGEPWGDPGFREFPWVVEAEDLKVAHPYYDDRFAIRDPNVVFPVGRLRELVNMGVVGGSAPFHYSVMGHLPRPARFLAESLPALVERLRRAQAGAVVVVAVAPLCHQTAALIARGVEAAGIPSVCLGVEPAVWAAVRPPRAVWVRHPVGATLGQPGNAAKQQQVLRDALDALEIMTERGSLWELPYRWTGNM